MRRISWYPSRRLAGLCVALVAALAALAGAPGGALAAPFRARADYGSGSSATAAEVTGFWTPRRMRDARALGLALGRDGRAHLKAVSPAEAEAAASFLQVKTPEVLPFAVEGRVFFHRGQFEGFCSGTAINSPTRQLVLTAGHCVNSGREEEKPSVWSNHIEFVPAYNGGVAPFGVFAARGASVYAPKQWIDHGNPDFDMGAFLTYPNSEGVNVADAVGGGATIVKNLPRDQTFQTFGYPGEIKYMQACSSPYLGDDTLTNSLPGPPTMTIRCRWAPGASGGGWLIENGTEIDGINTYLHIGSKTNTYGPYFSSVNIGRLVAGL